MIVAGIDPGLDGAIAFLENGSKVVACITMPVLRLSKGKGTKREISVHAMLQSFRGLGLAVERVFIEQVSPRPGEGTVASFKFGRGFGQVETAAIAMDWPVEYVTPQKWKKAIGLPTGAEKDDSVNRANQLLPLDTEQWTPRRLVMNQAQCYGRAEAALIACYGYRTLSA